MFDRIRAYLLVKVVFIGAVLPDHDEKEIMVTASLCRTRVVTVGTRSINFCGLVPKASTFEAERSDHDEKEIMVPA